MDSHIKICFLKKEQSYVNKTGGNLRLCIFLTFTIWNNSPNFPVIISDHRVEMSRHVTPRLSSLQLLLYRMGKFFKG